MSSQASKFDASTTAAGNRLRCAWGPCIISAAQPSHVNCIILRARYTSPDPRRTFTLFGRQKYIEVTCLAVTSNETNRHIASRPGTNGVDLAPPNLAVVVVFVVRSQFSLVLIEACCNGSSISSVQVLDFAL